jgi:cell division protein FtsW (lipid II flippase)
VSLNTISLPNKPQKAFEWIFIVGIPNILLVSAPDLSQRESAIASYLFSAFGSGFGMGVMAAKIRRDCLNHDLGRFSGSV